MDWEIPGELKWDLQKLNLLCDLEPRPSLGCNSWQPSLILESLPGREMWQYLCTSRLTDPWGGQPWVCSLMTSYHIITHFSSILPALSIMCDAHSLSHVGLVTPMVITRQLASRVSGRIPEWFHAISCYKQGPSSPRGWTASVASLPHQLNDLPHVPMGSHSVLVTTIYVSKSHVWFIW